MIYVDSLCYVLLDVLDVIVVIACDLFDLCGIGVLSDQCDLCDRF